jgi:hypothetical protein
MTLKEKYLNYLYNYANDFFDWVDKQQNNKIKKHTPKELLEIFKKEKGL